MESREEMIMKRVKEHYDEVVSLGYDVFAVILQGSQNYGLDEYSEEYMSDVDTKAIIIPSFKDLVSGRALSSTHIRANNEHIDIKDIREMFQMFKKQNMSYLELLVSDFYIVSDKYKNFFDELRSYAERIARMIPTTFLNALCGSARSKYVAMTHISPHSEEKIKKFGYDPKELCHLLRYAYIEQKYLQGSSLKDCITLPGYNKVDLMNIKKGLVYSKEEALKLADEINSKMGQLKSDNLNSNKNLSVVDTEMHQLLDDLCYDILYSTIRAELLEDNGRVLWDEIH